MNLAWEDANSKVEVVTVADVDADEKRVDRQFDGDLEAEVKSSS